MAWNAQSSIKCLHHVGGGTSGGNCITNRLAKSHGKLSNATDIESKSKKKCFENPPQAFGNSLGRWSVQRASTRAVKPSSFAATSSVRR
jgi:hypothetical protein